MSDDVSGPIVQTAANSQGAGIAGAHDLLAMIVDAATDVINADRTFAQDVLKKALALLRGNREPDRAELAPPRRGGLAPWQAKRVALYVREHIETGLRASDLPGVVRLSNSHFNRSFKVTFRETPSVYIMRERMRLAQEMMLTTAHPLSHVALQCGLCDQAHFSRMFRRFVGLSPRLWRRQYARDLNPSGCQHSSH